MKQTQIVVAEDSAVLRRLFVLRAEEEAGVAVLAQPSSENETVQAVLSLWPDALVLDLTLAPGSGLSVLGRIRRQGYAGHVFVFSSSPGELYAPLCRERGADGFYDKAFDFDRLLLDLRELREREHRSCFARLGSWPVAPAQGQGRAAR